MQLKKSLQRTAENISSMLQDVLRGAPTEVDAINGAVIRVGEQKGVPCAGQPDDLFASESIACS